MSLLIYIYIILCVQVRMEVSHSLRFLWGSHTYSEWWQEMLISEGSFSGSKLVYLVSLQLNYTSTIIHH